MTSTNKRRGDNGVGICVFFLLLFMPVVVWVYELDSYFRVADLDAAVHHVQAGVAAGVVVVVVGVASDTYLHFVVEWILIFPRQKSR